MCRASAVEGRDCLATEYHDQKAGAEGAEEVARAMGILPDSPSVLYVKSVGERMEGNLSVGEILLQLGEISQEEFDRVQGLRRADLSIAELLLIEALSPA